MPEPNLPPLVLNMTEVVDPDLVCVPLLRKSIPELPAETRQRITELYHLTPEQAIQIVNEPKLLNYFEDIVKNEQRKPKTIVNILINELLTSLNKNNADLDECDITSETLGQFIDLVESNYINNQTRKKVIDLLVTGDKNMPLQIVDSKGWSQINNESEIENICLNVIENHPDKVKAYKAGKTKVLKAFLGIIAAETNGRANMKIVEQIMEILLKK